MEQLKKQLENNYSEYYKFQHLDITDNIELNNFIINDYNNFIIINISKIVDILYEFIICYISYINDFIIIDWVDYVFNNKIYKNNFELMKKNICSIIKIELIKIKIFKDLLNEHQDNEYLTNNLNIKIINCKNMLIEYDKLSK
jgi:hypothetical protein